MGILGQGVQEGLLLKPVKYKWAMDLYDQAVANTWFHNEKKLGENMAGFKKMAKQGRHAITLMLSYFSARELRVNKVYVELNGMNLGHMYFP